MSIKRRRAIASAAGPAVLALMLAVPLATATAADSDGGKAAEGVEPIEPSGPGVSITTEAVAAAIRAADDAEDLAKRARKAIAAANAALAAKNRDEAKRQLEKAERLHARSTDAWLDAAKAATAAHEELVRATAIGTSATERVNLEDASADADRQIARAKAAVNGTQGPLDALRQAVK